MTATIIHRDGRKEEVDGDYRNRQWLAVAFCGPVERDGEPSIPPAVYKYFERRWAYPVPTFIECH